MNKQSSKKKILEQLKEMNALKAVSWIEEELYIYIAKEDVDAYYKPTIDLLKELLQWYSINFMIGNKR